MLDGVFEGQYLKQSRFTIMSVLTESSCADSVTV